MSYKELHMAKLNSSDWILHRKIFSVGKKLILYFSLWRNGFERAALTLFGITQAARKN